MVNIKVKDAPAIPAGIPTTVAYETILKVPNDADNVIQTLSASSKATMHLLIFLIISFFFTSYRPKYLRIISSLFFKSFGEKRLA